MFHEALSEQAGSQAGRECVARGRRGPSARTRSPFSLLPLLRIFGDRQGIGERKRPTQSLLGNPSSREPTNQNAEEQLFKKKKTAKERAADMASAARPARSGIGFGPGPTAAAHARIGRSGGGQAQAPGVARGRAGAPAAADTPFCFFGQWQRALGSTAHWTDGRRQRPDTKLVACRCTVATPRSRCPASCVDRGQRLWRRAAAPAISAFFLAI
jgi:hypothetical protein